MGQGVHFAPGAIASPEEIMDHIGHVPCVDVDQYHVIIIPDPAIGAIGGGQAVGPWIIDPIAVREEQPVKVEPDAYPRIIVRPEGCVIMSYPIEVTVGAAMVAPVITLVIAPCMPIPTAVVASAFGAPFNPATIAVSVAI